LYSVVMLFINIRRQENLAIFLSGDSLAVYCILDGSLGRAPVGSSQRWADYRHCPHGFNGHSSAGFVEEFPYRLALLLCSMKLSTIGGEFLTLNPATMSSFDPLLNNNDQL